jgi:hypothetical protein
VKPRSLNCIVVDKNNDGDRVSAVENFEMTLLNNTDRSQTQTVCNFFSKTRAYRRHCAPNENVPFSVSRASTGTVQGRTTASIREWWSVVRGPAVRPVSRTGR